MQGRQQRARVDLENSAGNLLDPPSDAIAVPGLEAQGLQDQHIERALDYVGVRLDHPQLSAARSDGNCTALPPDCQDMTIKICCEYGPWLQRSCTVLSPGLELEDENAAEACSWRADIPQPDDIIRSLLDYHARRDRRGHHLAGPCAYVPRHGLERTGDGAPRHHRDDCDSPGAAADPRIYRGPDQRVGDGIPGCLGAGRSRSGRAPWPSAGLWKLASEYKPASMPEVSPSSTLSTPAAIGDFSDLAPAPTIRSLTIAELGSLVSSSNFEIFETNIWDEKNAVRWIVARKIFRS